MPRVLHRPAEKNRKAWLDALKLDRDFGLCHHSTRDTHGQGCEAEAKTGGSGDNHTKSKNKTKIPSFPVIAWEIVQTLCLKLALVCGT